MLSNSLYQNKYVRIFAPFIGFFSGAQLDPVLLERDYLIMIVATIIFILFVTLHSSKYISLSMIRLMGFLLVSSYFGYLLSLSKLI